MKKLAIALIALGLCLALWACAVQPEQASDDPNITQAQTTTEAPPDEINIRPLLGRYAAEVWDLFGNETEHHNDGMRMQYDFDTGLRVSMYGWLAENPPVVGIGILDHADERYHFNGLNLSSSYEDVVAHFGEQGSFRDETTAPEPYEATFSYAYDLTEYDIGWWAPPTVRFFFAADNTLIAIRWFVPV